MSDLSARLDAVHERMRLAAARAGRSLDDVRLIAVSKRHPAERVREAYELGLRSFGENYAQELVGKAAAVGALAGIEWHAIGHLQTNKARLIAPVAAFVQTVDSPHLAVELAKRAAANDRRIGVLLEINVARDPAKSGCAPSELGALIDAVRALGPALQLRGLMTMPPETDDPEGARPVFASLRALRDAHGGRALLPELSMGMSHDFEVAIEEGATIIRVGTALFGQRQG